MPRRLSPPFRNVCISACTRISRGTRESLKSTERCILYEVGVIAALMDFFFSAGEVAVVEGIKIGTSRVLYYAYRDRCAVGFSLFVGEEIVFM